MPPKRNVPVGMPVEGQPGPRRSERLRLLSGPPPPRRSERLRLRQVGALRASQGSVRRATLGSVRRATVGSVRRATQGYVRRASEGYVRRASEGYFRRVSEGSAQSRTSSPSNNRSRRVRDSVVRISPTSGRVRYSPTRDLFDDLPPVPSYLRNFMRQYVSPLTSSPEPGRPPSPRVALNPVCARRLQKEFADFQRDPPEGCTAQLVDDRINRWIVTIPGPSGTSYEGGTFRVKIKFRDNHPFLPPTVFFLTKIYHANINYSGSVCVNILKRDWTPVLTASNLIMSIGVLMGDPNPDDPVYPDLGILYRDQREEYERRARSWTVKYAMGQGALEPETP